MVVLAQQRVTHPRGVGSPPPLPTVRAPSEVRASHGSPTANSTRFVIRVRLRTGGRRRSRPGRLGRAPHDVTPARPQSVHYRIEPRRALRHGVQRDTRGEIVQTALISRRERAGIGHDHIQRPTPRVCNPRHFLPSQPAHRWIGRKVVGDEEQTWPIRHGGRLINRSHSGVARAGAVRLRGHHSPLEVHLTDRAGVRNGGPRRGKVPAPRHCRCAERVLGVRHGHGHRIHNRQA